MCTLTVSHFIDETTVYSLDELRAVLELRGDGDDNSFWLAPSGKTFPALVLLVRGDLAVLH